MGDRSLLVGKVVAPFGLRGEVKDLPYTGFPERFGKLKGNCVGKGDVKDFVVSADLAKRRIVVRQVQGLVQE